MKQFEQFVVEVQVWQFEGQAKQALFTKTNSTMQEVQTVAEEQTKQLALQATQAVPLLKVASGQRQVTPSKI